MSFQALYKESIIRNNKSTLGTIHSGEDKLYKQTELDQEITTEFPSNFIDLVDLAILNNDTKVMNTKQERFFKKFIEFAEEHTEIDAEGNSVTIPFTDSPKELIDFDTLLGEHRYV